MTGLALACADSAPIRFNRKKYFVVGAESTTQTFLSLFHRYGYIYKPHGGDSWISADERWKLSDTEILKAAALAHPKYLLGTRFGKTTKIGIIDIDAGSPYHNRDKLHALVGVLTDAGLNEPVVYRSSRSGGWHLYLFFEREVPSREMQTLLETLVTGAGFSVQKGRLEIFPNRAANSLGYGIRLPLQPGFAWLDSQTLDVDCERETLSPDQAQSRFIADVENFSNSAEQYDQLKQWVNEQKEAFAQIDDQLERALLQSRRQPARDELSLAAIIGSFGTVPPGIDSAVWCRGRTYFDHGLSGPGQRADALFCLGHYLFYGDPERRLDPLGYGYEQEREHAVKSILALKNNGKSKDINRGRGDAIEQVHRATHWRPKHRRTQSEQQRFKKGVPIAWVRHNGNMKADTAKRIKDALDKMVADARPFTVQELMEAADVKSTSTLYAHKALWHKLYEQLKSLPADISDEYNAVVGAAAPQSGSLPQVYAADMPPGRLAARRVLALLKEREHAQHGNNQSVIRLMSSAYTFSWRSNVESAMPPDLSTCEARSLISIQPILRALLMRAPDEDHQIWLQEILRNICNRLDELRGTAGTTGLGMIEPESG
jgi:hypothetical protein